MLQATQSLLSESTLSAIAAGLAALRAAHVEPMGLAINPGSDSRLAWQWYKYKALPTHPRPGNARNGYSHPTTLDAMDRSAHARLAPPVLLAEVVAGMSDDGLWAAIREPILEACGLDGREWAMSVARYDDGHISAIDLTRGGVDPWAEYPDAGLESVAEPVEGYDKPVLQWGGEPEKRRARAVRRRERQATDAYMDRLLRRRQSLVV